MTLKDQEFQYTGTLELDGGKITLESPRLRIMQFTYHVEAQKLSREVNFYDEDKSYSYTKPFEVDYNGDDAFKELIVGLTMAYSENVSTI